MKILTASFLSLALALLSPGLGAQSAFAQVVGVNAGNASIGAQAGSVGAAGVAAVQPIGLGLQTQGLGRLGMSSLTGAPQLGIAPEVVPDAGAFDVVERVSALQAPIVLTPAAALDSSRAPPAAKQAPKAKGGMFNALREKFSAIGQNNAQADKPVEEHSVEFVVMFDGAQGAITQDMHLDFLNETRGRGRLAAQAVFAGDMSQQMENVGEGQNMYAFDATPIATYKRINAATVRIKASRADAFRRAMEARHHTVVKNEVIKLQPPIEDDPRYQDKEIPLGAKISMPDTLKLSTADKVHEIAKQVWGAPSTLRKIGRRIMGLFGQDVPQPKVAVLDTGADTSHVLLKNVKMQNMTPGKDEDDNGHGSWVTSMVQYFAPWLRSITHYKIFYNGSTTTDIILKALTKAANDGNLVMSNSWGAGSGNPNAPTSKLVRKLAEEGHIMVFAAGNSGYYGKNTIGDPAIVHYRTEDGTPRVLAVAATDRNKKVTGFSSKGPGSRTTSRGGEWENYPNKPDIAEQGENTEGAWPKNLRPDRTDPELGTLKAISGTSMSTPKQAGTIALLASLFGVTEVGKNLDIVVAAVMKTLTNEHNQPASSIGEGFNSVYAAYQEAAKKLKPAVPGATVKRYIESYQASMKPASAKTPEEIVDDSIRTVRNLRMLGLLSLAVLATGVLAWVGAGMLIEWLLGLGALLGA